MYEDAWYSFAPEVQRGGRNSAPGGAGHRRRESLLQQPNGAHAPDNTVEPLDALFEEDDDADDAEADLLQARADGQRRRAKSFPDVTRASTSTRPKWAAAAAAAAAAELSAGPTAPLPAPGAATAAVVSPTTLTGKGALSKTGRDKALGAGARRAPKRRKEVTLEALCIADTPCGTDGVDGLDNGLEWQKLLEAPVLLVAYEAELLAASQQEFLTYRDQLAMTERHLDGLIQDTNGALGLLSSLADAFRTVEEQTTSFRAQCDDLLSEQRRLQTLADEVGTDLHYYGYLDTATRRLNAPGASRLADGEELAEILTSLDSCIHFMSTHKEYRDADSYLARYQALLTKALHLLEVGFTARIEQLATELAKQIAATPSDSAQHALAYGRFEELLVDGSYALIPNVQLVVTSAYTPGGVGRTERANYATYVNTADNILRTYLQWRDQALRPIVHKETDALQTATREAKAGSGAVDNDSGSTAAPVASAAIETAARSFIKQSFERSYHEVLLFAKVFGVDPRYNAGPEPSVFATLRAYRSGLVNAVNVVPLATLLQAALTAANDLAAVCNVLGWITHEYLLLDYEDEDEDDADSAAGGAGGSSDVHGLGGLGGDTLRLHRGPGGPSYMTAHSRQMAARLLAEHLWGFADALFDAEVARTISKVPVVPEALKITPVINGQAVSNAYPPVRRALELLIMFDQAMPKERCQRNSPVVFRIVRETILALQRAEARIKAGRLSTDADLFMIKNLLILKNELLSLEIGDIRSDGRGAGAMQHFGQIWEAVSMAQNLVGYFSTFIPGSSSLWSRATGSMSAAAAAAVTVAGSGYAGVAGVAGRAASVVGSISGSAPSILPSHIGSNGHGHASDQDVGEQLDEALRRSITAFTQRWGKLIADGTSRRFGGKNVAKIERELDELLHTAFSSQPEVVAKLLEAIQDQAHAAGAPRDGENKVTRV